MGCWRLARSALTMVFTLLIEFNGVHPLILDDLNRHRTGWHRSPSDRKDRLKVNDGEEIQIIHTMINKTNEKNMLATNHCLLPNIAMLSPQALKTFNLSIRGENVMVRAWTKPRCRQTGSCGLCAWRVWSTDTIRRTPWSADVKCWPLPDPAYILPSPTKVHICQQLFGNYVRSSSQTSSRNCATCLWCACGAWSAHSSSR